MDSVTLARPAEPGPEDLRRLLGRMAALPSMRAKYADQIAAAVPDWTRLPVLTKDELGTAIEELYALGPQARGGAYIYASGGTMSEPSLSLIPGEMFASDILRHWRPLAPGDVMVNLFTPGRMWSAHYFYNLLATASGAAVIPFGDPGDEFGQWLDFFESRGASAMAATPTTIRRLLTHLGETGRALPGLRKLLWVGENLDDSTAALVAERLPAAELWGLYGSTETWVIGRNGPNCPPDTVHPLPYQHVEVVDGVILVTNTHPRCVNPLLRYRVGDLGQLTQCRCGEPAAALRVLGRADSFFKFLNQLVSPEEIVGLACELDDVKGAQLALITDGAGAERLEIRVRPALAPRANLTERVRSRVLAGHLELGYVVASAPETVTVRVVSEFSRRARTAKTPLLVVESADDTGQS